MPTLDAGKCRDISARVGIQMGAMVISERTFRQAAKLMREGMVTTAHARLREAVEQLKEHRCKLDGILRELEGS